MTDPGAAEAGAEVEVVRLYHGTDLAGANDLLANGVDPGKAAAFNGSGEFWATTDLSRADWFARSHPNSPPAARFEFDLPVAALRAMLRTVPVVVRQDGATDFEFLPGGAGVLNAEMAARQVVLLL